MLSFCDTFSGKLAQLRTLPPSPCYSYQLYHKGDVKDILISCHRAVLLICYMKDKFSSQECCLDLTGLDVLEDVWSKNGQWVGSHHNYNFRDLCRNTSHVIRLKQIKVDPTHQSLQNHTPSKRAYGHQR